MTDRWPMLQYVPIRGAWERVQYRALRSSRKAMQRVFRQRGLIDFAERMEDLRKNPRLNGAEKRLVFEGILNDYAKFVTEQQAPTAAAEADAVEVSGNPDVVVPSGEGGGTEGPGQDAAVGVPELERSFVNDGESIA
jgi:hypothetical protein